MMPVFITELLQGIHFGQSCLYLIFGVAIVALINLGQQHG